MVTHCTTGSSDRRNTLYKAYHGAIASRIKGTVGSGAKLGKLKHFIVKRISRKSWFSLISEIGKESLTVVKLNFEGLIIDGGPFSLDSRTVNLGSSLVLVF